MGMERCRWWWSEAKQMVKDSMQSPHDPEPTYSAHKGKGYALQGAEICVPNHSVPLTTREEVTTRSWDSNFSTHPALQERGILPKEMTADTHFTAKERTRLRLARWW